MVVGNSSKNQNSVNISIDIYYELTKLPIIISFSVPKDENDENYQQNIMKTSFNFCRIVNGVAVDFMAKILLDQIKKVSNIPYKCPFPKGNYFFTNFTMKDEFFSSNAVKIFKNIKKYSVDAKIMGKVAHRKNIVPLITARSFGRILSD